MKEPRLQENINLTNREQDIKINTIQICMAELKKDISYIKSGINDIKKEMDNYVTKQEFKPIQKIAYGLVGTVLTAITLALVYTVIK